MCFPHHKAYLHSSLNCSVLIKLGLGTGGVGDDSEGHLRHRQADKGARSVSSLVQVVRSTSGSEENRFLSQASNSKGVPGGPFFVTIPLEQITFLW